MTLDLSQLDQSQEPSKASCQEQEAVTDLGREAANMLELLSRQSASFTPLSISSQAAQAILKQF